MLLCAAESVTFPAMLPTTPHFLSFSFFVLCPLLCFGPPSPPLLSSPLLSCPFFSFNLCSSFLFFFLISSCLCRFFLKLFFSRLLSFHPMSSPPLTFMFSLVISSPSRSLVASCLLSFVLSYPPLSSPLLSFPLCLQLFSPHFLTFSHFVFSSSSPPLPSPSS